MTNASKKVVPSWLVHVINRLGFQLLLDSGIDCSLTIENGKTSTSLFCLWCIKFKKLINLDPNLAGNGDVCRFVVGFGSKCYLIFKPRNRRQDMFTNDFTNPGKTLLEAREGKNKKKLWIIIGFLCWSALLFIHFYRIGVIGPYQSMPDWQTVSGVLSPQFAALSIPQWYQEASSEMQMFWLSTSGAVILVGFMLIIKPKSEVTIFLLLSIWAGWTCKLIHDYLAIYGGVEYRPIVLWDGMKLTTSLEAGLSLGLGIFVFFCVLKAFVVLLEKVKNWRKNRRIESQKLFIARDKYKSNLEKQKKNATAEDDKRLSQLTTEATDLIHPIKACRRKM